MKSKWIPGFLVKRCPKSGRIVKFRFDNIYARLAFPVVGILAIIWFLFRVLPKPSRAAYPCQQVAAGIGGSFLVYLVSIVASLTLYQKIRKINKSAALVLIAGAALLISFTWGIASSVNDEIKPVLTPPDGVNNPMGEAKGIFPGRVSWTQDFNATSWDEVNGNWWDDNNTNQKEANAMLSVTLRKLSGANTDKEAWQKLFEFNNKQNGQANKGYTKGEKIIIKVNMNALRNSNDEWKNQGYPSPQMVYGLIAQLIYQAGVAGEDIMITDPSRFIGDQIINRIRKNPSQDFQHIMFEECEARNRPYCQAAVPDTSALVWFNMPDGSKYRMCFPKSYSEATYIINYSLVRPHRVFGITSAAKNHFGSVWGFEFNKFHPATLHKFALWDYPNPNKLNDPHSAPVLLGHKLLNSKTFLYLADGLYTAVNQTGPVKRMSAFKNDWFSSLLMSQDPVALESVVYDFISSEPNLYNGNPSFNGNQDNQFQECALAGNPPSGTKYDPENDGSGLQSLGVHEHWNNATERKYSGNMGNKKGIELISSKL